MSENVKLDKMTRNYREKLDQANSAHSADLKNVKDTNKKSRESQRVAYDKGINKTEKDYKNAVHKMSDARKRDALRKSEVYENALKKERNNFHDISQKNQKHFKKELSDINHDFKKLRETENRHFTEKNALDLERYDKTQLQSRKKFNKDIRELESWK